MSKKMQVFVRKCVKAGLPLFVPKRRDYEYDSEIRAVYQAAYARVEEEWEERGNVPFVINEVESAILRCVQDARKGAVMNEFNEFKKKFAGDTFGEWLLRREVGNAATTAWENDLVAAIHKNGPGTKKEVNFRLEWLIQSEQAFEAQSLPPKEVLVATKPQPEPQPFGLSGVVVSKFVDKLAANGLPLWVPAPGTYEFNSAVQVMYGVARDTLGEDVRQWRTGDIVNALGEPGTLELRKSVEGWWRGECYSSFVGAIQRVNWGAPPAASEEVLLKALRANNDGTNKAVTKAHNMFRYFWVAKMEEAFKAKLAAVVPAMPAATASEPTKRYARILDGGLAGWHTTVVFEYDSLVECFGLTEHMWKCTFTRCDAIGGEVTKTLHFGLPYAPGEMKVTAALCNVFNLAASHACSSNTTRLSAKEWEAAVSLNGSINALDIPPVGTKGHELMYHLSGTLYEVIAGTIGFSELLALIDKENVK